MSPQLSVSLRLSLFYAAIFAAIGIHMPFWPVWLKARGLNATEIGLLLAAIFFTKIFSNPFVGQIVDRRGDRRRPLIVLAALATLSFLLFAVAEGFWSLLAVTMISGAFFASIMPVGENLAMLTAGARNLDYGRLRLWGSLSFIAAAMLGGHLLAGRSPDFVLWLIAGALAATWAACLWLPDIRQPLEDGGAPPPLRLLLTSPLFLLFLAATSLIQISHMVYYGFATLYWRDAGIPDGVIGLLWAEGVVAEVLLFAFSGKVVARIGAARLIVLAGFGGLVRWSVLGMTTALPALFVAQSLHALTFGAMHLGAMHFITRAAPPGLSARAQALYSSVTMGVAAGLGMLAVGPLYAAVSGRAFLAMAGVALAGGLLAVGLTRRWRGAAITAPAEAA